MNELIQLTDEMICKGISYNGGWSKEQLHLIGVPWPPPKGWKKSLIGGYVNKDAYEEFVSLKSKHLEELLKKPVCVIIRPSLCEAM